MESWKRKYSVVKCFPHPSKRILIPLWKLILSILEATSSLWERTDQKMRPCAISFLLWFSNTSSIQTILPSAVEQFDCRPQVRYFGCYWITVDVISVRHLSTFPRCWTVSIWWRPRISKFLLQSRGHFDTARQFDLSTIVVQHSFCRSGKRIDKSEKAFKWWTGRYRHISPPKLNT